jgi:acyl carrier protein
MTITQRVRSVLSQHAKLSVDAASIAEDADLYAFGLSSFATVQLMLALEDEFDIELPEKMLNRRSFESVAAINAMVITVSGPKLASGQN